MRCLRRHARTGSRTNPHPWRSPPNCRRRAIVGVTGLGALRIPGGVGRLRGGGHRGRRWYWVLLRRPGGTQTEPGAYARAVTDVARDTSQVDTQVLMDLSRVIHACEELRFDYTPAPSTSTGDPRRVHPTTWSPGFITGTSWPGTSTARTGAPSGSTASDPARPPAPASRRANSPVATCRPSSPAGSAATTAHRLALPRRSHPPPPGRRGRTLRPGRNRRGTGLAPLPTRPRLLVVDRTRRDYRPLRHRHRRRRPARAGHRFRRPRRPLRPRRKTRDRSGTLRTKPPAPRRSSPSNVRHRPTADPHTTLEGLGTAARGANTAGCPSHHRRRFPDRALDGAGEGTRPDLIIPIGKRKGQSPSTVGTRRADRAPGGF